GYAGTRAPEEDDLVAVQQYRAHPLLQHGPSLVWSVRRCWCARGHHRIRDRWTDLPRRAAAAHARRRSGRGGEPQPAAAGEAGREGVAAMRGAGGLDRGVVPGPRAYHVENGWECLPSGVPVVMDKPMSTTAEQARRTATTGVTVFQNRRWDSEFLTLRRLRD